MPVLESVAAILRQMMPDLPMPVTMTRPRQLEEQIEGALEVVAEAIDRPRIASASMRSTCRARSSAGDDGCR